MVFRRLGAWAAVYYDVLFQRFHVRGLRGTTADDVCEGACGRTFIVTGPTSGIGTEIAAALARSGAHVVLACRSVPRGKALVEAWTAQAKADGRPAPSCEVMELDLSSLASVRAFAAAWDKRAQPTLHVLVNNAGVFDMGTPTRSATRDGHEQHFGTNYLAPALLTLLLLPHLCNSGQDSAPARAVFVSSKLHTLGELDLDDLGFTKGRRYSPLAAYAQSKLAEVLFCSELERQLRPDARVRCLSVHPGNVVTGVVRTLPEVVQRAYKLVMGALLLTPAQGARSTLYAACAPEAVELPRPGPYLESACKRVPLSAPAADAGVASDLWEATLALLQLDRSGRLGWRAWLVDDEL